MANTATPPVVDGLRTWTFDTGATVNFGNLGDGRGWKVLQIRANSASFSFQPKIRLTGSAIAVASAINCGYENVSLPGTNVAGTAITADAFIKVLLDGCDFVATFTVASGSFIVEERNVAGV